MTPSNIGSIWVMHDSHTQFIFILSKLHTGGVAAVADAARQQRSSVFAALAGKRSVPAHALKAMAAFLGIDGTRFAWGRVESWLARDDADLVALEEFGATLTVLARLQSSTEKNRGTAQKHYFLVKTDIEETTRYAVVRMRPSVSDAFQTRKTAKHVPIYIVDYRYIPLLHTISIDVNSDETFAKFVLLVVEQEIENSSPAVQRMLDSALEKAFMLASLQEEDRRYRVPVLESPTIVDEFALELANTLYVLEILDKRMADAVGKTNAGRSTTIEVMSVSSDRIHLSPYLIENRPQHLLLFRVHHINNFPVFEIVYDGPFEDILNIKGTQPNGSLQVSRESQYEDMDIPIKSLRLLNDRVPLESRLKKR